MNKILSFMAVMVISLEMLAVPAKKIVRTVVQSDGSMLSIQLIGDESFHYYATLDGSPVMEGADGSYYYSSYENEVFGCSGIIAHDFDKRSLSEQLYLNTSILLFKSSIERSWQHRISIRNLHRVNRNAKMRTMFTSKRKKPLKSGAVSHKKGLVILVNYQNKTMKSSTANADFNEMFNKEGYNKNRHIGSVRDYFVDQSYGQLIINFDVVGPYTLSKDMEYYGKNKSNGDDQYAAAMVAEACQLADADVNFGDYDWDGDGEVDQVYVIYAGYGEASGAPKSTIWPHEWQLSAGKASGDGPGALRLDNVKVDTYACSNELTGTSGSMMDGIGTACHEFSHCLGLPDFYDTSGSSNNFGMNSWSLMDYGCYNGPSGYDGNVPCGYTAYERWYSGWIDLPILDEGCTINEMRPITESQDAYMIVNGGNKNEYYVLTNIQKKSWNSYAYGHGLLIQHIDYSSSVWNNNEVNNTSTRQRCTIIPADNEFSNLSGDPFPGTSNKMALTDSSTPAATLYNNNTTGKKFMSKPIEDITETNGLISFKFNGGRQLEAPTATDATNVNPTGFTANWTSVDEAVSYNLILKEYIQGPFNVLFSEDFSKLSSIASNTDVTNSLDLYLSTPGWTGSILTSTGKSTIKLGTSQSIGTLVSPALPMIEHDYVTVYLWAEPYSYPFNKSGTLDVSYGGRTERLTIDGTAMTVTFPAGLVGEKVTILTTDAGTNTKRAVIQQIAIIDGDASVEDIESYIEANRIRSRLSSQTTYTGLTGTSYEFTDLSGDKYTYWVQAVNAEGEVSQWSNEISIVLTGLGIDDFTNAEQGSIEVYSLDGKRLDGWRSDLPKGIYLLKSGQQTKRVLKNK